MKERITITLDKKLLDWLDKKIEEKVFANRSHGFEFLVMEKIRDEKSEQTKLDKLSWIKEKSRDYGLADQAFNIQMTWEKRIRPAVIDYVSYAENEISNGNEPNGVVTLTPTPKKF